MDVFWLVNLRFEVLFLFVEVEFVIIVDVGVF